MQLTRASALDVHSTRILRSTLLFFFFNDTATTEIYTLSLHDALPISPPPVKSPYPGQSCTKWVLCVWAKIRERDRKSTRLNSSHQIISYAVFCLKKKKRSEPLPGQRVVRSLDGGIHDLSAGLSRLNYR